MADARRRHDAKERARRAGATKRQARTAGWRYVDGGAPVRGTVIVGIVAVLSVWTARAGATTVGVVRPVHPPPVTNEALIRVFGELRSLGLETRMLDVADSGPAAGEGLSPTWLRPLADERGVDAVIALPGAPVPTAVDVWAADGKGRSVARRVSIDPGVGHAPQTIAIRAIELLRSCLLEIDLLAEPPARKANADVLPLAPPSSRMDASDRVDNSETSRFGIGAGAMVLFTTDGVGAEVLPCLRLDWRLTAAWLVEANVAGRGARGSVDGTLGSARVSQDQALLGIGYRPLPGRRLRPIFSASMGALRTAVEGLALPPNQGHDVARWSFLIDGGAGASFTLGDRWDLIAAAHVQAATPYPAVRFLGQTVATAAYPNLLFGFMVEAWL